jgi:[ribosomal protein S18]-alanine N-acetyltransferase
MAVIAPVLVERMKVEDIPAVHEIERLSFSTPWPSYAFEQELTGNRMARYLVARAGERVVGFAGIWLMVEEAHITTFGVHPDWRRRGVGLQMLLRLDELSLEMGAQRMTLEVRVSNAAAQALYAAFGFSVVGRRLRYYTDDGEDALIMSTPPLTDAGLRRRVAALRTRLGQPGGAVSDR